MFIGNKYKPILLSELEIEYNNISENILNNKNFVVNGPRQCGKSTIVKLYLDTLNYEYTLIDNYNESKIDLLYKIDLITNSAISFFNNKKCIILFDNFDYFDECVKTKILKCKCQFIIISHKYININLNIVYINSYSNNYLNNLYININYLENNYYND